MNKYTTTLIIIILLIMNGIQAQEKDPLKPAPNFREDPEKNFIALPEPQMKGGKPLMECLSERHSSREYLPDELNEQMMSDLLWAANGINRKEDKKRTAPTSMNYQEMDVYVAMSSGLYLYDAEKIGLRLIKQEDIRATTGKQEFVKDAPINLVFVADMSKVKEANERQIRSSYANAAFIAQNVYLFCASEGLATVVRGYFEESDLKKAMGLNENQRIILCQTVGFPMEK